MSAVRARVRRPIQPSRAPADARRAEEVRVRALHQDVLAPLAARQAPQRTRRVRRSRVLVVMETVTSSLTDHRLPPNSRDRSVRLPTRRKKNENSCELVAN